MQINTIIFDLGGVLIDWNPNYVYKDIFPDEKERQWFFDNICTMDWNENQDAGYPIVQATQDKIKEFPEWESQIRAYYGRWEEMLGEAIQGTVDILERLVKDDRYRVVALTNWSAETFPIAQERFEFLDWFEGIVVSGTEKTRKPFKEIYEIILQRYNLTADNCLFIDDNARNVAAAEALGIHAVRFVGAKELGAFLEEKGI